QLKQLYKSMKQWVSQNKILSFIWFGGILWFVCVYWPGWHNPFFQDDFLLLDLAHPDKIRSIKDLFQPISLNFHYRPLAFNVYYYLLQTFFGLNWHAFHILNAIQLIGVSWLVYLIFKHVLESAFWA